MNGRVVSVNISHAKGTAKEPVPGIEIDELGVVGDAHAGHWSRQVSILSNESIKHFADLTKHPLRPGSFAENITTEGINIEQIAPLDTIIVGNARLQVVQIGKECHGGDCAIFRNVGKCIMPQTGVFCRVIKGGTVKPGDSVQCLLRPLRIRIVTVSDRASRGIYEDKTGPAINEMLQRHFHSRRWHTEFSSAVIPDEAKLIKASLEEFHRVDGDVMFIAGGTGIGPRDVTPEVVSEFCHRLIPGIVDYVRLKSADKFPNALLSRSIAGARDTTLVFALPGSPNATRDYLTCILSILEHAILMLHGVDAH